MKDKIIIKVIYFLIKLINFNYYLCQLKNTVSQFNIKIRSYSSKIFYLIIIYNPIVANGSCFPDILSDLG
jgi:hypothetical protein